MYNLFFSFPRSAAWVARVFSSLLFLAVLVPGQISFAGPDDDEVRGFFRSFEESFRKKDVPEIMKNIHKDFFYIMTYSTDGIFSYLESDGKKYRENLGAFFKSEPKIIEYEIVVDDIHRSGDEIMVLAQVKSIVQLNGVINSCDVSSNYKLQYVSDTLLIRDIRGDASCSNALAD